MKLLSQKRQKIASDNLIEYFEEQGDLSTLILALYKERPRNPEVQYLIGRLRGFFATATFARSA